jgi:hypothetical protein
MVRKMLRLGLGTRVAGATLAIVPVLAAACGGSTASAGPGATVPHAAPTSTTSADPYAVPSPITAAYVQRVLDAIEGINNQATLIMVQQRQLSPPVARLMRSISTTDEFSQQTKILLDELDKGLPNYRSKPAPVHDSVHQLVFANGSCIFAATTRDLSGLLTSSPPLHVSYFILRRLQAADDPTHLNPTPWVISFLGYNTDNSLPDNTCVTHP